MASAFQLPCWLERILRRHNASPIKQGWTESAALYRLDPIEQRLLAGSILIPTPSGLISSMNWQPIFGQAVTVSVDNGSFGQAGNVAATAVDGWSVKVQWSEPSGFEGGYVLVRQLDVPEDPEDAEYGDLPRGLFEQMDGDPGTKPFYLLGDQAQGDSALTPDTGYSFVLLAYTQSGDTITFSSTATQIDGRTLHPGDATGDGVINTSDLLRVSQNYGQTGKLWRDGDFNGDGTVNSGDLLILSQNYNTDARLPTPTVTATAISSTQVQVSWELPSGSPAVEGFEVWYATGGSGYQWAGAYDQETSSLIIGDLDADTTYQFVVNSNRGNGRSEYSTAVTATTEVATLSPATDAEEGSPTTLGFTDIAASLPTPLQFSFQFDGGDWSSYGSAASIDDHVFDDSGIYAVGGRIKDGNDTVHEFTGSIYVANVAPTATFSPSAGSVIVDGSLDFSFSSQADVSAPDEGAGFTYSYDFDNDGQFDGPGEFDGVTDATKPFTFTSAGTYSVNGLIADKDGGYSWYTARVTVGSDITAPSDPKVVVPSGTQAVLTWQDNSDNEDGFLIERRTAGGSWQTATTTDADEMSHTDDGLTPGTFYEYRVSAVNGVGQSAFTDVASETTIPDVPSAPASLAVSSRTDTQQTLSWSAGTGGGQVEGYEIEQSLDGSAWTHLAYAGASASSYVVTGLDPSTTYHYRLWAYNAGGEASATTYEATTAAQSPAAPSSPSAVGVYAHYVDVAWTDASNNESGFEVQWSEDAQFTSFWGTSVDAGITGLSVSVFTTHDDQARTIYTRVRALGRDTAGASAWSLPSSVTLPADPQAVSGNRGDATYGGDPDLSIDSDNTGSIDGYSWVVDESDMYSEVSVEAGIENLASQPGKIVFTDDGPTPLALTGLAAGVTCTFQFAEEAMTLLAGEHVLSAGTPYLREDLDTWAGVNREYWINVQAPGTHILSMAVSGGGSDSVKITAYEPVDLVLDGLTEEQEVSPGLVVFANDDDDNKSAEPDRADTSRVSGEGDLIPLELNLPGGLTAGAVVLSINGDAPVAVWTSPERGPEAQKVLGRKRGQLTASQSWVIGEQPAILWVEAQDAGDISFALDASPATTNATTRDAADAQALHVAFTLRTEPGQTISPDNENGKRASLLRDWVDTENLGPLPVGTGLKNEVNRGKHYSCASEMVAKIEGQIPATRTFEWRRTLQGQRSWKVQQTGGKWEVTLRSRRGLEVDTFPDGDDATPSATNCIYSWDAAGVNLSDDATVDVGGVELFVNKNMKVGDWIFLENWFSYDVMTNDDASPAFEFAYQYVVVERIDTTGVVSKDWKGHFNQYVDQVDRKITAEEVRQWVGGDREIVIKPGAN